VVGLIALAVVLVAASAAGAVLRRRQGRFHAAGSRTTALPGATPDGQGRPASAAGTLTAGELGGPLGAQATLVQFSAPVCAYCGPTRELLTEVAQDRAGVAFIEVDAAERMDLTRRLHVLSTPTVLVLDAAGGIASRASGPVRRADIEAVIGQLLPAGGIS
jgi:thiol-disulfide isomerase/thioredoxin